MLNVKCTCQNPDRCLLSFLFSLCHLLRYYRPYIGLLVMLCLCTLTLYNRGTCTFLLHLNRWIDTTFEICLYFSNTLLLNLNKRKEKNHFMLAYIDPVRGLYPHYLSSSKLLSLLCDSNMNSFPIHKFQDLT